MLSWLTGLFAYPLLGSALRLLLLFVLLLLAQRALRGGARRLERQIERTVDELDRRGRLKTLLRAGYSVAVVTVVAIAVTMALQILGVYIVPMLVSAGVVGLAISLGAQSLIRDYISGILLLVEDHFRVGDMIEVNAVSGEVVRITLRVTYLRNVEGKLHAVPNGDIRTVTNLTREWSRAVVDIILDYGSDFGKLERALQAASARLKADPALKPSLLGEPESLSWNNLTDAGVQVRVMAKTAPGQQWAVGRALRRYVLEALEAEGLRGRGR